MSASPNGCTGLPDFDQPPVQEVIGAVQFTPLPRLGLQEMIKVGELLEGYTLAELQPQLPPIQEAALNQNVIAFPQFFFGEQPQRAIYNAQGSPFVIQLQQDRIAVNERRSGADVDPSSEHVWPQLQSTIEVVQKNLVAAEYGAAAANVGPASANLVELTYANAIQEVSVGRVLRAVSDNYGDPPRNDAERTSISFSFSLMEDDEFVGRIHVQAGPGLRDGEQVLQLQLVARRLVNRGMELGDVYDACHRDAVETFAAITEPDMHRIWGRTR